MSGPPGAAPGGGGGTPGYPGYPPMPGYMPPPPGAFPPGAMPPPAGVAGYPGYPPMPGYMPPPPGAFPPPPGGAFPPYGMAFPGMPPRGMPPAPMGFMPPPGSMPPLMASMPMPSIVPPPPAPVATTAAAPTTTTVAAVLTTAAAAAPTAATIPAAAGLPGPVPSAAATTVAADGKAHSVSTDTIPKVEVADAAAAVSAGPPPSASGSNSSAAAESSTASGSSVAAPPGMVVGLPKQPTTGEKADSSIHRDHLQQQQEGAAAGGALPPPPLPVPVLPAPPPATHSAAELETPDWLPPNATAPMTIFVGRLPSEEAVSHDDMRRLLSLCGPVTKWDRRRSVHGPGSLGTSAKEALAKARGWKFYPHRDLGIGFATYANALGAMRALRLLHGLELGGGGRDAEEKRALACTVGSREKDVVEEAEDARNMHLQMGPVGPPGVGEDAPTAINEDEEAERLVTIQGEIEAFVATLLAQQLLSSPGDGGDDADKAAAAATEGGGEEGLPDDAAAHPPLMQRLLKEKPRSHLFEVPDITGMDEEEAQFEMSLAEDVEKFRLNQREREERLDRERRECLWRRVRETMKRKKKDDEAAAEREASEEETRRVAAEAEAALRSGALPDPLLQRMGGEPPASASSSSSASSASASSSAGVATAAASAGYSEPGPLLQHYGGGGPDDGGLQAAAAAERDAKRPRLELPASAISAATRSTTISAAPVLHARGGNLGASSAASSSSSSAAAAAGAAAAAAAPSGARDGSGAEAKVRLGLSFGGASLKKGTSKQRGGRAKRAGGIGAADAFAEEAEKKRVLVRLDDEDGGGSSTSSSTNAPPPALASDPAAAVRDQQLLAQLQGKDLAALLACPVDWEAASRRGTVDGVVRPWVRGKTQEYLGEENETLTDFVVEKLKERAPPHDILREMKKVLEDEAEGFVKQLWKKMVFESSKSAI